MKIKIKILTSAAFILIIAVLIIIRIIYVNTVIYSIPQNLIGTVNSYVEYNGIIFEVSQYKIYSREQLDNLYDNSLNEICDDYDILFNLTVTNSSNETKKYNAAASGMMFGYENGGNVNPGLYMFFNEGQSGIITLKPQDKVTVTLAFPCNENPNNIQFIVSLYPENVKFKLK